MCLPKAGGGVVLCIPHAVFDHLPHQAAHSCDVRANYAMCRPTLLFCYSLKV